MPKSKKKQKKGPSTKSPSSGRRDKGEEEEGVYNVGILEQDLVKEYRTLGNKPTNYRTMIVMYRMNCEKNNSGGSYEGRVDFRVGVDGTHVMSRITVDNDTAHALNLPYQGLHLCDNERVSTPHCMIKGPRYPDDFIWIQDLKSEHGTFVNGKKINSGEKCRVFYGDIVGLGAPYDNMDTWGDPKDDKRGFMFTVKNFKICESESKELPPEPEHNPTPKCLALNNPIVWDTIVKFLRVGDLKAARLVNRCWKNRVNPRFIGSTFMSFSHGWSMLDQAWNDTFQGKVSMIKKYVLANWKLEFNQMPQQIRTCVHAEVHWLVKHMGHHVRNLELLSDCWPHPWGSNIPNVMSHFRNLEKLKIAFELPLPLPQDYFSPPTTFPSVTQLNLNISFGTYLSQEPHITPFSQMFPNIRKFESSNHQFYSMIECIHANPELWPNLKELVGSGGYDELENQSTLRMISTLPQKLTKIKCGCVKFSEDSGYKHLEQMMNNHASTLEHLDISFKTKKGRNILKFPSFPRLKVLELLVTPRPFKPNPLGLEIIFPSGGFVCYEKDLPEIQKLSVNFHHIEYKDRHRGYFGIGPIMEDTMDVFVPEYRETVSRTMRWVDLGIRERDYEEGLVLDNRWYEDFLKSFTRVFPYVHDPYVIRDIKLLDAQRLKRLMPK